MQEKNAFYWYFRVIFTRMCKNKLLKEKTIQRELFVIEKPTLLTKRRQMKNPRQQLKVFGRQKWQQFKIRELLIEPYLIHILPPTRKKYRLALKVL